jgi:hypothetical protein
MSKYYKGEGGRGLGFNHLKTIVLNSNKPMSTSRLIKTMSNKALINTVNKIRKEKANPAVYGKYGTTRWVTNSEFWRGYHHKLNSELALRKRKGLVSKMAGKPRR